MIKGSTVIFNEAYITELSNLKTKIEEQLKKETFGKERTILEEKLQNCNNKLNAAMDFQDTIEEVLYYDVPSLVSVRTLGGYVLPMKHVDII